MRLFFAGPEHTPLADAEGAALRGLRSLLLQQPGVVEVAHAEASDAVILQEPVSFKEWRYVPRLLADPLIGPRLARVYTVNQDDCATGLLKGAYTSLPQRRFDGRRHVLIPYSSFPNPLISQVDPANLPPPTHLASWRGNPMSAPFLREALLKQLGARPEFRVERSSSWLNHNADEHRHYLELLAAGWFSLCPRGWSPITYRIYESLALGRVPVLLADGLVLPQGPNWPAISLRVPERQLSALPELLEERLGYAAAMGQRGRQAWLEHYSPARLLPGIAAALLALMRSDQQSPADHELERRRLQGWRMAWGNRWTPPQRLINRFQRLRPTVSRLWHSRLG